MSKRALVALFSMCLACFIGGCGTSNNAAPTEGDIAAAESSEAPTDGIIVKGNVEQVISKLRDFEESDTKYSGIEVTGKIAYIEWVESDDRDFLSITLSDDGKDFSPKGSASCVCGEMETMQSYAELNKGDTITVYGVGFLLDENPRLTMMDCDVLDTN